LVNKIILKVNLIIEYIKYKNFNYFKLLTWILKFYIKHNFAKIIKKISF